MVCFIIDYTFAPARTVPSAVQGGNATIPVISSRWSTVGARCPPELHTGRPQRGLEYTHPMKRLIASAAVVASVAIALRAADSDAGRWWPHVEALANDGMEGRNTGSPAHKRAAEYVAAQFREAGLEPAGADGYMQPVEFKTRTHRRSAVEPRAGPRRQDRAARRSAKTPTSACASIRRRPSTRRSCSSATA